MREVVFVQDETGAIDGGGGSFDAEPHDVADPLETHVDVWLHFRGALSAHGRPAIVVTDDDPLANTTSEQYEASIAAVHPVEGRLPEGQIFHAAGPSAGGWTIMAVHDSKELGTLP